MSKVRNFAEIAPNISFSEFDFYDLYRTTFEKSELGRIKKLLPLREMAENFGECRKIADIFFASIRRTWCSWRTG